MGRGIAQMAAQAGSTVLLFDVQPGAAEKARLALSDTWQKLVDKNKLAAAEQSALIGRVACVDTLAALAPCDLVVEAVVERLDVKQKLFTDLEAVVEESAVLATNTSSLSVTAMAADLAHPERVVGFHFFNPVAVMPLLEIARAEQTDDETLATAFAVGKSLKKTCVLVKDAPAFVVNRLLTRYMGEVIASVDEGTPIEVADHAGDALGLPMSPFSLLALVGPAVAFHVTETMHAAYPDRFSVSENMRRIVEAGKTAILVTGEDGTPAVDPEIVAMLVQGDAPQTVDEVRVRATEALADEARRMLDEGVVAEAQDIDLCMIMGAGWPFWLGGITPYLDRSGAAEAATGRRFLPQGVASVPV